MHGAVGLHGDDPRRLAAVGQAHGAGADCSNVVYGGVNGKLLLTAYSIRIYRAGGDKQLRLFHRLLGNVVGIGRVLAIGYGDMHRKALLFLLPQHIEVIRLQRHRIGAFDALAYEGDFQCEHIFSPARCRLRIVTEDEGAVHSRAKVCRYGHLAVIRLAQQGQDNVYPTVHHAGHIAICVGFIHAVIQIPAVDDELIHNGRGLSCRVRCR